MKKWIAILLCAFLFAGCSISGEDAYVPTGNGLTWEADYTGQTQETTLPEITQELTLTCYPNKSMNPLACTDFTNQALFSLVYQSLDGLLEAIGLDRDQVCTYCWTGEE